METKMKSLTHAFLQTGKLFFFSSPNSSSKCRINILFYPPLLVLPHTLCIFLTICRSAFRESMNHVKEKIGYTTVDLGVAPEKIESCEDGETKVTDPMDKLKSVRGYLVLFPLQFMCQEDLRPMFIESEFYTSPQVFH